MVNLYNDIINQMMENDKNCSMDLLIKECEYNYNKAYKQLKDILQAIIERDKEEDIDSYNFHVNLLSNII